MPATARTFVTGSAHSTAADFDGDGVGDGETDADADAEAELVAEGDADAGVLSFTDDPAGIGVAGADAALESAGDDGALGDTPAVTSALELDAAGSADSEPTRGDNVGSALATTGSLVADADTEGVAAGASDGRALAVDDGDDVTAGADDEFDPEGEALADDEELPDDDVGVGVAEQRAGSRTSVGAPVDDTGDAGLAAAGTACMSTEPTSDATTTRGSRRVIRINPLVVDRCPRRWRGPRPRRSMGA